MDDEYWIIGHFDEHGKLQVVRGVTKGESTLMLFSNRKNLDDFRIIAGIFDTEAMKLTAAETYGLLQDAKREGVNFVILDPSGLKHHEPKFPQEIDAVLKALKNTTDW